MAEVKSLILEFRSLHLDRQVINSKAIVKFGAQFFQQVGLRNRIRMNYMRAQRFAA